jgi:hypothetical protein
MDSGGTHNLRHASRSLPTVHRLFDVEKGYFHHRQDTLNYDKCILTMSYYAEA